MKSSWGPGPWQSEPDRVEFEHAGLPCILHRNDFGAWCGYAAVPPGHPVHGQGADVDVHGGVNYASRCQGSICHVAKPGEPDDVWWLGFDCGHACDLAPGTDAYFRSGTGRVYRDIAYARRNVESLAEQLAAMVGGAA